ncbi:MAG: MBL fold metallo-hydrolase [Candidatus Aenigmarchaeota archaeon]|nr:MBL fold metallo-hydrolase [Candidatus Aenigmarchaeota archaeon]
MVFEYKGVKLHWLGHDCFRIEGSKTLIIDPFKIERQEVDIVLVTHDHFDHCSVEDIKKIEYKTLIASVACKQLKAKFVKPGDVVDVDNVKIKAVPAYNIDKFRSPGQVFHPKQLNHVGFVIEIDNVSIYHAGDTDFIPEMKDVKADIALLPVSGTYVMTAEEATKAVEVIRPEIAIPMHFGSIVGSKQDAEKFKKLAKSKVVMLELS